MKNLNLFLFLVFFPSYFGICQPVANNNISDWNFCDRKWFADRGYSWPFASEASEGVSVNFLPSCDEYRSDWQVYNRMLDYSDGNSGRIHFELYNRKLGVLRTFIYIPKEYQAQGQKHSVYLDVINIGEDKHVPDHAYFNYQGSGQGFPISQNTSATLAPPVYIVQSKGLDKWIIVDTYLSYDPTDYKSSSAYSQKGLVFRYRVQTHDLTEIKLNGTSVPSDNDKQLTSSIDYLSAAKAFGGGLYSGFTTEGANGLTGAGDMVKKIAKWKGGSIGKNLEDLATAMVKPGMTAASILAGTNVVTSIFSSLTGGTRVSFPSNVINLTGVTENVRPTLWVDVPVASSVRGNIVANYSIQNPEPAEQALGLFNLNNLPSVKVYFVRRLLRDGGGPWSYYYVYWDVYADIDDLRCKLLINPTSGVKLKDLKVQPSSLTFNYPATSEYYDDHDLTKPPPITWSTNYVDPTTFNLRFVGRLRGFSTNLLSPQSAYDLNRAPIMDKPICYPMTLKALFTFQVSPGSTLDVMKEFKVDLEQIIVKGPTIPDLYDAKNSYQATMDIALANSKHSSCGYTDPVTFINNSSNTTVKFSYADRANWYMKFASMRVKQYLFYYDIPIAQATSGWIGHNQKSTMVITFTGSQFDYYWKVSSEPKDKLELWIDGVFVRSINGKQEWIHNLETLAYGNHTVKFTYSKDGSETGGDDRGYVTLFKVGSALQPLANSTVDGVSKSEALRESGTSESITVYPNPFTESFNINVQGKQQSKIPFTVYNIEGKVVIGLQYIKAGQRAVIGGNLAQGIYILVIGEGVQAKRYKLIKTH